MHTHQLASQVGLLSVALSASPGVEVVRHRRAAAERAIQLHLEGLSALPQERFQPPQGGEAVQTQWVGVYYCNNANRLAPPQNILPTSMHIYSPTSAWEKGAPTRSSTECKRLVFRSSAWGGKSSSKSHRSLAARSFCSFTFT